MAELEKEEITAESDVLSPEENGAREWDRFEVFYKQLLVGSGVVLLTGIVLAVLMSWWKTVIFTAPHSTCSVALCLWRTKLQENLPLA